MKQIANLSKAEGQEVLKLLEDSVLELMPFSDKHLKSSFFLQRE